MKNLQFALVVIDYKVNTFENKSIIPLILEKLRLDIYRNQSLLISKQTLLVKLYKGDLDDYISNPKYHIEDIIIELEENEECFSIDFDDFNIYCLPINVDDFENELAPFQKEIKYLKNHNQE